MGVDPAVLGEALAARMADIAAAIERYDAYAFSERPAPTAKARGTARGTGGVPPTEAAGAARDSVPPTTAAEAAKGSSPGDRSGVARDLALAALRAAGDPLSYAMLQRMAGGDTPLSELSRATGLPRLAVWERVNGLVAVGLAGRRHEDDSAGLTPAGLVLVGLVEEAVAAADGR